ncbi:MAG: hypothetical protein WCG34_00655 [Leptolinea sp.]
MPAAGVFPYSIDQVTANERKVRNRLFHRQAAGKLGFNNVALLYNRARQLILGDNAVTYNGILEGNDVEPGI